MAPTIHLIHCHCLPILSSLTQEQTVAMLQEHQDGKNLAMRCHFCKKQNELHAHVPQYDTQFQSI